MAPATKATATQPLAMPPDPLPVGMAAIVSQHV